jgi:phosphopantothenoylcysteine decarboxylase/phosphopantothenate--cysteine ligase
VIAANVSLPTPAGAERVDVATAAELEAAVRERFPGTHLLLMAAAVADYRPADAVAGKIAREQDSELELRLEPTEDVLASVAASREPGQVIVGFAAEHGGDPTGRAREKLGRKGVDAIVVNDVSRADIGFDSEQNEVVIVDADGDHPIRLASKDEVAEAILDRISASVVARAYT